MNAIISSYKETFYFRDYSHDTPEQRDVLKRIALASLPFLSLHSSLRLPISLGTGFSRVVHAEGTLHTAVAIAAVAGTVFQHRAGMILTTLQDLILEVQELKNSGDWEKAAPHLVKIINHLLYLALIARGGLELSILSLAMQIATHLLSSKESFKKGRWIEGVADLAMTTVRLHQTYGQVQQLRRNWDIKAAMKRVPVGALREKWRFPSDHLPVGVEVNGVRVISWNVLNNIYMIWVTETDSQGLKGSLITELHDQPVAEGLTQRDLIVADRIQDMFSQGEILALQECGAPFIELLRQRLPSDWEMVTSFATPQKDQDVVLFNKAHFTYQPKLSETSRTAYPSALGRPLQNVYLSHLQGEDFRIINAHIPGDPTKPGREEFARYVCAQHKPGSLTLGLGDNNFEREEMLEAYQKAGLTEFSFHSPWKTNVGLAPFESKGIDHIAILGEHTSRDLSVPEIWVESHQLQETIDLLNGQRN